MTIKSLMTILLIFGIVLFIAGFIAYSIYVSAQNLHPTLESFYSPLMGIGAAIAISSAGVLAIRSIMIRERR